MIACQKIAAGCFQLSVNVLDERRSYFDFAAAHAADQMVMVIARNFIHQVPLACVRWPHQAILGQEFKRPIHRCLREAGQIAPCLFVDLGGREMSACMF